MKAGVQTRYGPPEEVLEVREIDEPEVFSAFDALAAKHGLEKIKTVGDAYMAVGGLLFLSQPFERWPYSSLFSTSPACLCPAHTTTSS